MLIHLEKIRGVTPIRIEVEMKKKNAAEFIEKYTNITQDTCSETQLISSKSLWLWEDNANKWGQEFRLYFEKSNSQAMPEILKRLSVDSRKDRPNSPYTSSIKQHKYNMVFVC